MRKYSSLILGILLIVLGGFIFSLMANSKNEDLPKNNNDEVVAVKVKEVKLSDIPYVFEATGTLSAKEKIELFSEVQGILKSTRIPFKTGNTFSKGQVLIAIDSEEHRAQIKSSRSDLINQLAAMLPDMEIDYPNLYSKWELYLKAIDVNALTPQIPEITSNEEKLFISGKSIFKTYYNIKNLEERLRKYNIRAPFSGSITESNVNKGTLIRSGQKIGEIISNRDYELELTIPASEERYLVKGSEIELSTLNNSKTLKGRIIRVNGKVDQQTQSIVVVAEVKDKSLKDGQYLKTYIIGDNLKKVFKIDNALILQNNQVYTVIDSVLQLKNIKVKNYQDDYAVVEGLEDGTLLVDQTIANAYPGMPVKNT